MTERIFAFIFARGGSKGLPRKNIKMLLGKPLIAHSISIAQQIEGIERVFVSTEDAEIASVARAWGANVIDRPAELATDTASEWLAWRHAVEAASELAGPFDTFLSLPATSPLRSLGDIQNCLKAFESNIDVVITVTPASRNPFFNMVTVAGDGTTRLCMQSEVITRRQDAPSIYDMTTVAYVTRPAFVLACNRIFDGKVRSVVVPRERAIDIDDELDFRLCELLASKAKEIADAP